jgi:hypothetical protein
MVLAVVIASCEWSNPRDNPNEPVDAWSWDTRPFITQAGISSLSLSWRHVAHAESYRLYYVNAWGPPVIETLVLSTTRNGADIDSDIVDYSRVYRIKAYDGNLNVIDCSVLRGYNSQITPGYAQGTYREDFETIAVLDPALYAVKTATGGNASAYIAGNALRADLNSAGTYIFFGYDPGDAKYVRISYKTVQQHNSAGNMGCGINILSSSNNLDCIIIGNSIIDGVNLAGVEYYPYDRASYSPSKVNMALNSSAFFNMPLERVIVLDRAAGTVRVRDNGTETAVSTPFAFPHKLIVCFIGWSTGSGDYATWDDIDVSSSPVDVQ